MPHFIEFAREPVCASASLHNDGDNFEVTEKRQQLSPREFLAKHLVPLGILRMQMKDPLADIDAD